MKKDKKEIIEYINTLKGYEGYVQFSHRPIDKDRDIFYNNKDIKVEDESGFICEAHFYNGKDSITIKQINTHWLIDEIIDTPLSDVESYLTDIEKFPKIKMAQIWEAQADDLCAGMDVKKLKKVVFAGFIGGEK